MLNLNTVTSTRRLQCVTREREKNVTSKGRIQDQKMSAHSLSPKSESESFLVMSHSLRPHGLYSPWNSPVQNTGVGSLSLLQWGLPNPGIEPRSPAMQADSLPAEPQVWKPQARSPIILAWVAYPFSSGSS